jgi:hypothetical protein
MSSTVGPQSDFPKTGEGAAAVAEKRISLNASLREFTIAAASAPSGAR